MEFSSSFLGRICSRFVWLYCLSGPLLLAQTTCIPPAAGLVSWWRGESNAVDSVSGNNGVFSGAAYGRGEVGATFSFGSNGNSVRVPASASLDVGNASGLTIEGWIDTLDNSYGRPIAEWVSPTIGGYAVHFFAHVASPAHYTQIYTTRLIVTTCSRVQAD